MEISQTPKVKSGVKARGPTSVRNSRETKAISKEPPKHPSKKAKVKKNQPFKSSIRPRKRVKSKSKANGSSSESHSQWEPDSNNHSDEDLDDLTVIREEAAGAGTYTGDHVEDYGFVNELASQLGSRLSQSPHRGARSQGAHPVQKRRKPPSIASVVPGIPNVIFNEEDVVEDSGAEVDDSENGDVEEKKEEHGVPGHDSDIQDEEDSVGIVTALKVANESMLTDLNKPLTKNLAADHGLNDFIPKSTVSFACNSHSSSQQSV